MSDFAQALSEEVQRLRIVLKRIADDKGADAERLKRIARDALEKSNA